MASVQSPSDSFIRLKPDSQSVTLNKMVQLQFESTEQLKSVSVYIQCDQVRLMAKKIELKGKKETISIPTTKDMGTSCIVLAYSVREKTKEILAAKASFSIVKPDDNKRYELTHNVTNNVIILQYHNIKEVS